jgi:hypothetical protein
MPQISDSLVRSDISGENTRGMLGVQAGKTHGLNATPNYALQRTLPAAILFARVETDRCANGGNHGR